MKELKINLKFLSNYFKSSKRLLIMNIILNILLVITSVVLPIISAKVIVELTNYNLKKVLYIAIILVLIRVFSTIINYFRYSSNCKIYNNILSDLRKDSLKRIHSLTNQTLDNNSVGLFVKRVKNDSEIISKTYWRISNDIKSVISTIGTFIAIFIINKTVFLFALFYLFLIILLDNYNQKKTRKLREITNKESEITTSLITETIHGIRDIKMLNIENNTKKLISNQITKLLNGSKKENETNSLIGGFTDIISNVCDFLLIILYIYLIKENTLSVVNALVLYNYSLGLSSFHGYTGEIANYISKFNLSTKRIKELFDNEKFTTETFGTKHIKKVKGKFEFKSVHFSYKRNEVLKGVSFTVNPDETVAFVGKTGSGKTTIFNLLCKMYEVDKGEILIDNININELDKNTIRGNITVISQSPYIFNMSIKENLKLVKPNLTNKEMKEALKTACLYDFVESLPDKYDTILGEGGVTLSGGQKQRLAIARALIQKTEIILFDEATSALDNETQEKITKAINNMKKEYTIMIIAHRLSTIINADKIFFLNNGKIECSGTHEYLLKHSKEYKQLYETEIKTKK